MKLELNEREQQHIYVCLLAGETDYKKAKKQLTALAQSTNNIDIELALNADLRRRMNPHADEEARAKKSGANPNQMDLVEPAVLASARRLERRKRTLNETDGVPEVTPAGDQITDYELQSRLSNGDCFVAIADLAGWTSSEREAAYDFARRGGAAGVPEGEGWPSGTPPHVMLVALRGHEIDALLDVGPYRVEEAPYEDEMHYTVVRDVEGMPPIEEDTVTPNDIDADLRAARLNKGLLPETSLKDEALEKLQELGIGDETAPAETPAADVDHGEQGEEPAEGHDDEWTLPHSVRVSDDGAQAIQAASEEPVRVFDECYVIDDAGDDASEPVAVAAAETPKKSRGKKKGAD